MRGLAVPILLCTMLTLAACEEWKRPFQPKGNNWQKLPVARTPLPDSAYRVRWDGHTVPREMQPSAEIVARVSFTNLGNEVWPDALSGDPVKRDGGYAVRLTCQWVDPSDPSRKAGRRIELPRPVRPGETMTLLVNVKAPPQPGQHRLVFELVQELVAWFDAKGGEKLVIPVSVKQ